jgi:hypothetical protein
MTPGEFVSELSDLSISSTFNPYAERCPVHDRADAPKRRRDNLRHFLEGALACETDTIWIARDLGYRGGRRTGLPLTDEIHLAHMSCMFDSGSFQRATLGPAVSERTAAIVWSAIRTIQRPVFLWNVFPLHPHEPDDPFSNRCHTRAEREMCKPLLLGLLEMMQPRQIVAIGRDAQAALSNLGVSSTAVRHPSYGGQAEFKAGVYSLYEIDLDLVAPTPERKTAESEVCRKDRAPKRR